MTVSTLPSGPAAAAPAPLVPPLKPLLPRVILQVDVLPEVADFVSSQADKWGFGSVPEFMRYLIRRQFETMEIRDMALDSLMSGPGPIVDDEFFDAVDAFFEAAQARDEAAQKEASAREDE